VHGLPKPDCDTVATHREADAAFWHKIGSTWTTKDLFVAANILGFVAGSGTCA